MSLALVTGGAGFIGSHLAEALLKIGWQVRVLDNFVTGKQENLANLNSHIEIIHGDIRDADVTKKAVKGVELVFHEAAFVSVPQSMIQPGECFDVNVRGTETLLFAAKQAGVRRVLIASSAAVYGDTEEMPLREDFSTRSLSPYAASKNIDETLGDLFTRAFGLDVVSLRYFNVFGPRQNPESQYAAAIPIFISKLLAGKPITIFGDGGQTRDLIFVEDIVRANLTASEHRNAPGKTFNICSGRETKVIDLVNGLCDLFPGSPKPIFVDPRPGDIYRSVGNPNKAKLELDFAPLFSLSEGLKSTVEWMRN